MYYQRIPRFIIIALTTGIVVSGLSIIYSSCGGKFDGHDCRYVSDVIFVHGFPFGYYFTGGIAGIQEFHAIPFLLDVLSWSLVSLLPVILMRKLLTLIR